MIKFYSLRRQLCSLILITFLFPTLLIGQSYTLKDDDVEVDDNGIITSCSYDFSIKEIIIPETLDGKTIKGIGDSEDFGHQGITSVELPSTLISIGDFAFTENSISSIDIPDGVKYIGEFAFSDNKLAQLTIPVSVDSIRKSAFIENEIESVNLPTSIKYIGPATFNDNKIATVNSESSNGLFYARTEMGAEDKTCIVSYGGVAKIIDFISDEVSNIYSWAFYYNDITSLNIPANVTYIGSFAFCDNKLTSVEIPFGVTEIYEETFSSNLLSSVIFKGNVTFIGTNAFFDNKLVELDLPNTLEIIGNSAFAYNKISELNFNSTSKLKVIGSEAFRDNLFATVAIPQGVTSIGYDAFSSISSFELPSPTGVTYTQWMDDSKNSYAFGDKVTDLGKHYFVDYSYTLTCNDVVIDANGIIQNYKCNGATDLTIPETLCGITVKGIANKREYGDGVFSNCGLVKVLIPSNVEKIGSFTFGSNYLSEVSLPNQITFLGEGAFVNNKILTITLPIPEKEGYTFKYQCRLVSIMS